MDKLHRIKVLVVDDQQAIADTFALILNQNGFEAVAAHSGAHAIDAARQLGPDVLITDVHMDGMNGIEAAAAISVSFPLCRLLLMSGHPNTGRLVEAAKADGHTFEVLAKPLHPDELIERLRRIQPRTGEESPIVSTL